MLGWAGAVVALFLLVVVLIGVVVFLLPEWMEERHRRRSSEEAAERLRQRVREVRAEADAAKDALVRCQQAAAALESAARKLGDPVDVANELIVGAEKPIASTD